MRRPRPSPTVPLRRGFTTALALLLATGAVAQPEPPHTGLTVEIESIDVQKFPLLGTVVAVLDPGGRAITRMDRSSLSLAESGLRARLEFFRIDLVPRAVALLIDISGSMLPQMLDTKRAAALFVRLLEPSDQAMLMAFAVAPRVIVPFTTDHERLVTGLGPLEAHGPTALHDAVHAAVLELKPLAGRKAVVVLTDGRDQNETGTARQSRHTLDEAIELARSQDVRVYTVGLGPRVDQAELRRLASETEGSSYFPPLSRFLGEIYKVIAANLKGRIEIHYRTPDPQLNGTWRALEVKVAAKGHFGADQASYRAPGRYVVDVPGQGFERLKVDVLSRKVPQVVLRDVNLREVLVGAVKEISEWLAGYYKRPAP